MKRLILTVLLVCAMLANMIPMQTLASNPPRNIKVFVDGLPVSFDVQPIIKNGRTLVPFRAVSEALSVEVTWEPKTQQITALDPTTTISLQVGSTKAVINNTSVDLDVPPSIMNGRTLIPLRFFSEAFNCQVSWDAVNYTVNIISAPKPMTVLGFYALGDSQTSSWTDLFEAPYPQTSPGNTDLVNEVALGWYSLDPQGMLVTRSTTGWQRPDGWQDVLKSCEEFNLNPQMVVHITDKNSAIMNILKNPDLVNNSVDSISAEAKGYGGVNLNFEGLGLGEKGTELQSTRDSFTKFVTQLAQKLHSQNLTLTVTIHAPNSSYPGYDYKALGQAADNIVVMAYDYGTKPEPTAKVIQAVEQAKTMVPAEKLILGISVPNETPESILVKVGIAKRYGLKGVAIWRLGLISDEMWNSLRTTIKSR